MVMNKKRLLTLALGGLAALFFMAGVYAKEVPEMIELNDPAYEKHKKGIVIFSHGKHQTEYAEKYPEFYKNGCGECHHDENNKPLNNLKEGDNVQNCIECHNKPGLKPKGKGAKKLSKKETLEYHGEAIHQNCKGCHREFNKKNKTNSAPTKCKECHPQKKK